MRLAALCTLAVSSLAGAADTPDLPPYAKPDTYVEREAIVGSEPFKLPATLTLPKSASERAKVPAAVLVHGSGPNDRDGTVFKTKPLRDLAVGLASRGIAVIRYEKRTKQHGFAAIALKPADLTPEWEVIDDALAAAAELRKLPQIDPDRVFIVGHSMGGTLAPAILARDKRLAGFVSLAGTCRPIEDVVLDQYLHFQSLRPEAQRPLMDKDIEDLRLIGRLLKSGEFNDRNRMLGLPLMYWKKLNDASPWNRPAGLDRPMLIVQGGRDYQVTDKDFSQWKKLLGDRPLAGYRIHPRLNHLLVAGDGVSGPAEYGRPGFVAEEAVRDVADWMVKVGK